MITAENRQFVKASSELIEEISKKFSVTTRSVKMALAFQSNSPSARLYRSYALEHGGEMYKLQKVDNPHQHIIKY